MNTSTTSERNGQAEASELLTVIQRSLTVFFPRRDEVVAWLNDFIRRSGRRGFILDETDSDNLTELEKFLRAYGVLKPDAFVAA